MEAMIREMELNKFLNSFKARHSNLVRVCYIFNVNRFLLANSEYKIQEYVETQKDIFCSFNEIHGRNNSENLINFNQVPYICLIKCV